MVALKNNEKNGGIASLILKFNTSIRFTTRLFCPSATSEYEAGEGPRPGLDVFREKRQKYFFYRDSNIGP